jgi:hypothetical protein
MLRKHCLATRKRREWYPDANGEFIVDHLEAEAAARGLNYIYNVVPVTNPDPGWITAWLTARGFVAGNGDLRRRVRERATP